MLLLQVRDLNSLDTSYLEVVSAFPPSVQVVDFVRQWLQLFQVSWREHNWQGKRCLFPGNLDVTCH